MPGTTLSERQRKGLPSTEKTRTDTECPQGCADPMGGMRRVVEHTGDIRYAEIYGEVVADERVERYLECGICGWVVDL
ncbi:hypothetical protein [Halomarina oriensis]|uniref:Uncharacterized protein n=1 Tax=Halomarina oriensis TaxID=671145 RepID=A0A6B0GUD4_9EURY|nr:hypothetical protein [Halomarina oriensis]MWG36203.1 hypothetical protein [Halomarina oriensis]